MICEVCRKRNADIVFKTVTAGQVATRAMCMDCAQNMQQEMMKVFLSLGFRPEQVPDTGIKEAPKAEMPRFICTQCGRPYSRLDENTMAGCASCYQAMEEELADHFSLDPMHGDAGTAGADSSEKGIDVNELKYRLLEAVIREDFEEAALLRDQIQSAASGRGEKS